MNYTGNKIEVISLTDGKVCIEYLNKKKVVIKESSFDEVKKIEEARKTLKTHKIEINNIEYSFHLPKIYAFKNNKIYWKDFAPRNI